MEKAIINGKEYSIDFDKCKEQGLLIEETVYPKDIYELCNFEKTKGTVYIDNCNIWHKGENLKDLFHKEWFSNWEETKAFVALRQLIQLRDWWWDNMCNGWRPENESNLHYACSIFSDINSKTKERDIICCSCTYPIPSILIFPTEEIRDKFFEAYRDLIEKAKMFL